MPSDPDPLRCPECHKTVTTVELFFGRCQVCGTDIDPPDEEEHQESCSAD